MKLVRPNTPVFLALVLGIGVSFPSEAARWVVVSSANTPGLNETRWKTDLNVVNPGDQPAPVKVTLLSKGKDNSALSNSRTLTVPAQGQSTEPNVLSKLFSTEGSGALLLESTSTNLAVASRTYNEQPDRSYGMYLPALTEQDTLSAGETGHIIFVAKSDRYRTNIIFLNLSAAEGTVTVRLFDEQNRPLGSPVTTPVLPYSQDQFNAFDVSGAPATASARAEVTATVPFVAVATVVDAKTGDPFAVMARRASYAASDLILPAAAHIDGDKLAKFRSDVRAFNASSEAALATFSFYPAGVTSQSPETRQVPIPPMGLAAVDDIVLSLFGNASGSGAIRITSSQPLMVTSVTYNDAPEGTSGQDLPAIPAGQLISTADVARLSSLLGTPFRTNLLFFNPGSADLNLELSFKSPGSDAMKKNFLLKARSMDQINRLLESFFQIDPNTSGYLEVKLAESKALAAENGSYWVLATVVENTSNDPFQVTPEVQRNSSPPAGTGCVTVTPPKDGLKLTSSIKSGGVTGTLVSTFLNYTDTSSTVKTEEYLPTFTNISTSFLEYELKASDPYKGFVMLKKTTTQTTLPVIGAVTITLVLSEPRIQGPGKTQCAGVKWSGPNVALTNTTTPPGFTVPGETGTDDGEIFEVNKSITTPAGTFNTVHAKTKHFYPSTGYTTYVETWVSTEHGVAIKQISTDKDGQISEYEATKIE